MQTPATRPHARVLTHSLTLGESDRSPPVESACFDRFAVTVSTERVGWWIEQRFHHRAPLGEPRGMQTPTPHPQTCVWKLCARPDLWPAVCADPDVTDVTRSHRVSGESWVAIDGGVPYGFGRLKSCRLSRQMCDKRTPTSHSACHSALQPVLAVSNGRFPVYRGAGSSS